MSDVEDIDDMDLELDGAENTTQGAGNMVPKFTQFINEPPPDGIGYGEPRLARMPATVVEAICERVGLREIIALRLTCKALNKSIAIRPAIWTSLVRDYRRVSRDTILLGNRPVVMPNVSYPTGFQEDILRCGFILRNKWHNPAFQARQVTKDFVIRRSPYGINQARSGS
ncbi:hypothetical protein FRC11_004586 [Ceratobasidium sp. 423]|nr:hypothetical protein FRC11_004586 [Ceratobasidium sp. 423]